MKSCATCTFFELTTPNMKMGVCHAHPPMPTVARCSQEFWCGEFKQREPKGETVTVDTRTMPDGPMVSITLPSSGAQPVCEQTIINPFKEPNVDVSNVKLTIDKPKKSLFGGRKKS